MFLLVMSLSGSILVFHDDIDHAIYEEHLALNEPAQNVIVDASFETIRRGYPGWEIRLPELPQSDYEALKYELRNGDKRKWVIVHPETGAIMSTVDEAHKRLVFTLLTLHFSFFAGTTGKALVLMFGIIFLIALVTGLMLYRKSLAKVLLFRQKISLKNKRAFLSSTHRIVGVWGLVFNVLICITGIRISYVVVSNALNQKITEIAVPPISRSVDGIIENVSRNHPDFSITYIKFPSNREGKLQLLGHLNSDPAYYGETYSNITINYETGEVEGIALLRDKPFIDRVLTILQPLHFGNYAGFWIKIIYALGGLLPAVLSISGFVIWYFRNSLHRQKPEIILSTQGRLH